MHPRFALLCANIEAAQPVSELPRDLADRHMAPAPIPVGKAVEQGRRGGGERHFEVEREGIVIDSVHASHENKYGTSSQSSG